MIFGNDRNTLRKFYQNTWQKALDNQALNALEQQIALVISQHSEYQAFIKNENNLEAEFFPELGETNPFLHMGLHLAIREQVMTNRPAGIAELFNLLLDKQHDPLLVEHQIMEVLVEMIWQAQKLGSNIDENQYLSQLKSLTN